MKIEIKDFDYLINTVLPNSVMDKLNGLKVVGERNDYHPEANVYEHIKIVVNRLIKTDDIDLILTGVFHDICKLDSIKSLRINGYAEALTDKKLMKVFNQKLKDGELKSFGHAEKASEYIKVWEGSIQYIGGNFDIVREIVANHMRAKQLDEMRPSKQKAFRELKSYDKLMIFTKADNMLKDFKI